MRAFNFLINTGKALYWGTSEWLPSEIEEAWAVADKLGLIGPVVEQPGETAMAQLACGPLAAKVCDAPGARQDRRACCGTASSA